MKFRSFILTIALLGAVRPATAQVVADSGGFFVQLGKDTIAVERYVRTPYALNAEAALRTPQTRAYKFNLTFRDDGTVSWYEVINDPVPGVPNATGRMRMVATYAGDSVGIQEWVVTTPVQPRKIAGKPAMIPLQMPFYSTLETALINARKAASDTVSMDMLSLAGPLTYAVRFGGADSVTLSHPIAGITHARFDKAGRLLALDAQETTFKVVVTRAKWPDIDAYLRRYALEDSAGRAFGALSPRAVVNGDIGDAEAIVDYGRPSARGRRIFGGIVPWGQVWRTGANQATTIHFTDTVVINNVTVPAGKYSLWTIPDAKQWLLIINKQAGQWGTSYDEKQDLARIPVVTETVAVPEETFTIGFKESGPDATVMTLTWDKTRVLIPIRKK